MLVKSLSVGCRFLKLGWRKALRKLVHVKDLHETGLERYFLFRRYKNGIFLIRSATDIIADSKPDIA
jgi:hypothetical protein